MVILWCLEHLTPCQSSVPPGCVSGDILYDHTGVALSGMDGKMSLISLTWQKLRLV